MTQTEKVKKGKREKDDDQSWGSKIQLFFFIALWAALAMLAFLGICHWLLGSSVWNLPHHSTNILEVVKVSLTLVGGVGAVGYLVIKYQERQAARREEIRRESQLDHHRFGEAIELFGSKNAITRMAGVHALIKVANADPSLQQEIVNLLCGYLRSKRNQDNACESHIISLLRRALSGGLGVRWRDDLFLDLHGAVCDENFKLSDCTLKGMNLEDVIFNGDFRLYNITMNETFKCSHTQIKKTMYLQDCTFKKGADLSYTHVGEATGMRDTTFNSPNTKKVPTMRTETGSRLKTRKEYPVNLMSSEFLGWFYLKNVEFNTDCLLAAYLNFLSLDRVKRIPATFGTIQKTGPGGSINALSDFYLHDVKFNEALIVDGVDPMYFSCKGMSVTIGREDVKEYVHKYIESKSTNQV